LRTDTPGARGARGRLALVLAISTAIFVAEVTVGLLSNSLAVLADAGHVLADVVGTAIALAAMWIAARPATRDRTFGFYRFEILAAVLNAVLLFAIAAFVLIEAARRLSTPPDVAATPMILGRETRRDPRPSLPLPRKPVRHRAFDVSARNRRPHAARGRRPPLRRRVMAHAVGLTAMALSCRRAADESRAGS